MNPHFLSERAVAKKPHKTRHDYTEDELNLLREGFTELSMQISDEEEDLREIVRARKEQIKLKKLEARVAIQSIRQRYRESDIECYLVPNFAESTMEYYAVNTGELVDSRRLRPDERQQTIFLQAEAA